MFDMKQLQITDGELLGQPRSNVPVNTHDGRSHRTPRIAHSKGVVMHEVIWQRRALDQMDDLFVTHDGAVQ